MKINSPNKDNNYNNVYQHENTSLQGEAPSHKPQHHTATSQAEQAKVTTHCMHCHHSSAIEESTSLTAMRVLLAMLNYIVFPGDFYIHTSLLSFK